MMPPKQNYFLVIDPKTRRIDKRTKSLYKPLTCAGSYWANVTRAIWKRYRAGDIVSPSDLSGYDLQRLASW